VIIKEDSDNIKLLTKVKDIKINSNNEDRINYNDDVFIEGAAN
jgi:hypothetical protein